MTISEQSETIYSHPLLQFLQSSHTHVYENVLCSKKENGDGAILLLPPPTILERTAIKESLVEAHILQRTSVNHHYLSLLGHGIVIMKGIVSVHIGIEGEEVKCNIIGRHTLKIGQLTIEDGRLPDSYTQSRQTPFLSSAQHSAHQKIEFDNIETKRIISGADLLKSLSMYDLEIVEVIDIIKSFILSVPKFGNVLNETLLRLDQTLLYLPGCEIDISIHYKKLVQNVLIPYLFNESLSLMPSPSLPILKDKQLKFPTALMVSIPRLHLEFNMLDYKQFLMDLLERYIYSEFQPRIWESLVSSYQEIDAAIDFYLNTLLNIGLPDKEYLTTSEMGSSTVSYDLFDLSIQDITSVIDNSTDRVGISLNSRLYKLSLWLNEHGIKHSTDILNELLEEHSVVGYIKQIHLLGASISPQEKLQLLVKAMSAAQRISVEYFPSFSSGVPLMTCIYPTESVFTSLSLCLLLACCLTNISYLKSHAAHMSMAIPSGMNDIPYSTIGPFPEKHSQALEYFNIFLNHMLEQVDKQCISHSV